jgi:sarcosine oxidase
MSELDRREFLKVAGVGAGAFLAGTNKAPAFLKSGLASTNVVVVGAGAFGGWTALNLRRLGAKVTMIDMYGPGNSRATSGDESRGVRSSYGDRTRDYGTHKQGEVWMQWARQSMKKWVEFDAEYSKKLGLRVYYTTGDVIMRAQEDDFTRQTRLWWEKYKIPHEVLTGDEVRKRWPQWKTDDINYAIYEPDAGVVRARRSTEAVAEIFRREKGTILIERVVPPDESGFNGSEITLTNGTKIGADLFVFCTGPWSYKTFDNMKNRMRTGMGQVFYWGTPPGDYRFTFPNMPSWNFSGATGWAALPNDSRGFRVRGGGGGRRPQQQGAAGAAGAPPAAAPPAATQAPGNTPATSPINSALTATPGQNLSTLPFNVTDPDLSQRYVEPDRVPGARTFLESRFPALKDMPLLATHACHYEQTSSGNFIIDRHPTLKNIWISAGGNAEGFKSGPVIGEYTARRVLGKDKDEEFAKQFAFPAGEFDAAGRRPTEGEDSE